MRRPLTPTERLFVHPSLWRTLLGVLAGAALPFVAAQVAMLDPIGEFPTIPFFVAVVAATMIGRLGPGLLGVGVSVLLIDYHFIGRAAELTPGSARNWAALAGFALVALAFAYVLSRRDLAVAQALAESDRLAFVSKVGDAMASTLDYETRLQELPRLCVPALADWCAIQLTESGPEALQTVALAHANPEKARWAQELQTRYPPDPNATRGAAHVVRTGQPELYRRIRKKMLRQSARDEEHLRMLERLGMRSGVVVPITARGRVIGALTLITAESRRRYGPADVSLAGEVASRAGLALENARLYSERNHIAETLQRALLPPALPRIDRFETAAFYRPALEGSQVGGDFYDVFPMADGSWLLVIGDACGKGPEAAAVTGLVRYTVRAVAVRETSPAAMLEQVNETLMATLEGDDFATVAIARVEPTRDGARLVAASGGHPRPVVLRRDGSVQPVGVSGVIVGAFEAAQFSDGVARLRRGDTLLMYTDGLTSKDEGDCMAEGSRLRAALAPVAGQEAERVLGVIRAHVTELGQGDPHDDIAVLAFRATPARKPGAAALASVMPADAAGTPETWPSDGESSTSNSPPTPEPSGRRGTP